MKPSSPLLSRNALLLAAVLLSCFLVSPAQGFVADRGYLADRALLERVQRDAFRYMWEDAHPVSGMPFETTTDWIGTRPVAVGGTGFGVAAVVVAADRGWITREQAVTRVLTIATFLRDKSPRRQLHGAFPHWLNGETGQAQEFSKEDTGADIVETALLFQGLLIARAYFNGPGVEQTLRDVITELWEDVDWNWFTNGEEKGLYWHWTIDKGFSNGLKILGFNECHIAYVLAMASPTHPISRKTYDYWTSGDGYKTKSLQGYRVEAALPGGGPLFLAHYSYIGLDPRKMADSFVPGGYFARNVAQTLSNRAYCLQAAPARNKYAAGVWGLTASLVKNGYEANDPLHDTGTVAPTAALSSMPYTPHFSMQVLEHLSGPLRNKMWGKNGPFDAFSLRDNWYSKDYIAIDQLPIVCMVENYRSGLLWDLMMGDKDVQAGLAAAGISEPSLADGFPEAVVTLKRTNKKYVRDAYDIRRHPETGSYLVPYWVNKAGVVSFVIKDKDGQPLVTTEVDARSGRNYFAFPQFMAPDEAVLSLVMTVGGEEIVLPVRLH